jgi:Putative transposase/Transposase zinc-binding domain
MGHPALASPPPDNYRRREPAQTALYGLVSAHWAPFLEQAEEVGGLPKFVTTEFEAYLRCGILEHGCIQLGCRDCGHSQLVAFSCKKRGFCSSCLGRRMTDTATHLVDRVLPEESIRHWICSLPWQLRVLLGYNSELCSEVLEAFVTELSSSYRWRAKKLFGLARVSDAQTGAVAAIQRSDSALRLNVHFHVLALDGVYMPDSEGHLEFRAMPKPTQSQIADVAKRTADRVEKLLRDRGLLSENEANLESTEPPDQPGLFACYELASQNPFRTAGGPSLRAVPDPNEPVAEVRGINIHAKQLVDGRDRKQLERLCRYITRPPLAQERLTELPDGRYRLELKSAWKDGTRAVTYEPMQMIARLVAAIPPPRSHMIRYFGVLSSHANARSEVVPKPPEDQGRFHPLPAAGDQVALPFGEEGSHERVTRKRWAWLLRHVFAADLEHCPKCSGPMRWSTIATKTSDIARLMLAHGLEAQAPPEVKRAEPKGQLRLPFGR